MTSTLRPRLDILPSVQRQLWPQLSPVAALGFVLYGGTAIALRLGHRQSIDFDFFTDKTLDRDAIRQRFSFMPQATVLQDQENTFTVLAAPEFSAPERVKISFFGAITFGRVNEPAMTEDGVMLVASLDDLMATKLKVILQRAEAKDYRDIAAMISVGVSLSAGLAAAREMIGPNFQPSESLKALVYFDDGDLETLTTEEQECLVKAVSEVRELPRVSLLGRGLANAIPSQR